MIQGTLENTLNDLDHGGYVPWELQYIDVQDSQDPVNPRKVVRILHGNGGLSNLCTRYENRRRNENVQEPLTLMTGMTLGNSFPSSQGHMPNPSAELVASSNL